MLLNGFSGLNLGSQLPTDLKSMPTLQGMMGGMTPPTDNPKDAPKGFSFGKIGDAVDTKLAAKYLQQKGLIGADQLVEASPNTNDPNSIRNNQGDWKISAIQHIMANAKRLGINTPEAFDANMDVLTNTLDPKYRQALKDPSFAVTNPNWSSVLKSILKDQSTGASKKDNLIAKK